MSCQRSKQKILESAGELFYHVGYQTTSIDDILLRCGVARSNFYYHFKSKEELACAVIEVQVEEFETLLLASLQNRAYDPAQRLAEFCAGLCRVQAQQQLRGCPFGNFAATLSGREDEQAERFRRRLCLLFRQTEAALRDCLIDGVRDRQFRDDIAPSDLATLILATIEGVLILTKTYRDRTPLVNGLAAMQQMLRP
jgi:TetR/AcrR family transcriptional regulator, transcriptional repressor for nem operon